MAANTTTQPKRSYGIERTLGDIILNKDNNSVFCNVEGGFFGRVTLSVAKDKEHGGYVFSKSYTTKDGQEASFVVGRTFPVKDKGGSIVEGLTQGLFGLIKEYDATTQKSLTSNKDALQITTHKLKEHKKLGDSNLYKVGYLTGRFCIEKVEQSTSAAEDFAPTEPTIDIQDEEIPF